MAFAIKYFFSENRYGTWVRPADSDCLFRNLIFTRSLEEGFITCLICDFILQGKNIILYHGYFPRSTNASETKIWLHLKSGEGSIKIRRQIHFE